PPPTLHSFPTRRSSDLTQKHQGPQLVPEGLPGAGIRKPLHSQRLPYYTCSSFPKEEPASEQASQDREQQGIGYPQRQVPPAHPGDRKSTRLNSSHVKIS